MPRRVSISQRPNDLETTDRQFSSLARRPMSSPGAATTARDDRPATERSLASRAREAVVARVRDALGPSPRQSILSTLSLTMIIATALMLWKTLILCTMSDSPIVVVLSGSMEPGLRRGDLLVLENWRRATEIGETVVFNVRGRDVPIVHRIVRAHGRNVRGDDARLMLTKGDNNFADDIGLYAPGQRWLTEDDIVGRAFVFLPHVGRLTILMNDYPAFKVCLLAVLGYYVVTGKD